MESQPGGEFPEEDIPGGEGSVFGFSLEELQQMWENNQDEIMTVVFLGLIAIFTTLVLYSKRKSIKSSFHHIFTGMLERDTSDELDLRVNLDAGSQSNRNMSAATQGSFQRPVYLPSFVENEGEEDLDKFFVDGFAKEDSNEEITEESRTDGSAKSINSDLACNTTYTK